MDRIAVCNFFFFWEVMVAFFFFHKVVLSFLKNIFSRFNKSDLDLKKLQILCYEILM